MEEKKNYEVREGKYLEKLTIFIWRRRKQRRKKIGERKKIFFEKKNGEGKYLEMEKVKGKQKGGKYHGEGKIVARRRGIEEALWVLMDLNKSKTGLFSLKIKRA